MSMASNRLQQKITLPDRVSQLYYAHGLFCSSHPVLVLSCAAFVVLLCCYPLLSIPLPGNAPQQLVGQPTSHNTTESENYGEQASLPRWLSGPPLLYVHQILLRVAVCPWAEDLLLTDAFRAPLSEVFRLLESVANYQHENSSKTLSDVCLHVESAARLKPEQRALLPEYNCLMLSPASLWRQEPGRFLQDPTPLHTVFNYQTLQRGKVSLAEMLLGLNLKDTGIKRYPLRSRQRVLQYAVTLFLRVHDSSFMDGLHHKLRQMYPFHQQTVNSTGANNSASSIEKNTFDQLPMTHIYYPGEFSARGLIPLIATYLLMFLYMYFSMRKIELLKSKFGVSVSAALTVLASLFMSVGLCFFFGLTLTLSGREFYPYLVVIVGLENVFVLTKSVVSTPAHLDVKIRVAQGLSREGWSITKNLLTEVTILTIGLFTLVPAIQEFCIFAIVGLLSDFFLQVVFFSTILAMDIRRAALDSISQSQTYHSSVRQYNPQASRQAQRSTLSRSRSHPRLDLGDYPTSVVAPPIGPTYASAVLVPKRLRLVHFWARTRIVQRGFMLFMILWIGAIAINSGVVEQLLEASVTSSQTDANTSKTPSVPAASWKIRPADPPPIMHLPTPLPIDDQSKISCPRLWSSSPWPHTSPQHWSSILSLYNISIAGNYLTVLPPLRLAMAVSPDRARTLRRPGDEDAGGWSGAGAGQWQALVAALDPVDLSSAHDSSATGGTSHHSSDGSAPFVPQSPMELLLTAILCIVSVGVLAYTTVVLYRCICSRHYAEWRAGWSNSDNEGVAAEKQVVLREAVPLILDGHNQQVEWICSDSGLICSSCLGGHLRAWDGQSGELLAAVDRTRFFAGLVKRKTPTCSSVSFEDLPLSDYESGSPPSRGDPGGPQDFNPTVKSSIGFGNFPDLRSSICTNFTSSGYSPSQPVDSKHGYDFGDRYSSIFEDFFAQNTSEDLGEWGTTGQNCVQMKSSPPTPIPVTKNNSYSEHQQSYNRRYDVESGHLSQDFPAVESLHFTGNSAPPVWCLDFKDNLLVAGCSNGRLEFWEASTGTFKCIFDDGCGVPVTGVKLVGNRVVVAKLNGAVDFLELESFGSQGRPLDWGFTSIRRTHVRSGSTGSLSSCLRPADAVEDDVRCRRLHTVRAHQQPITVLDSEGGRVVTGSQDHTLKIFRLEDQRPLYTLHGHCGPITCLFIDCMSPLLSGSGSQDGMLCVWDLLTGACMYSIQAHDGAVSSVTYSASYVITVGADERICVWERFQGHLLNTIILGHSYCSSMVMLTHNLLVTSKQGSLIVWDVRTGEAVRVIRLGGRPSLTSSGSSGGCGILVKQIVLIQPGDSIACDYGNEVRVVRFPVASDKVD